MADSYNELFGLGSHSEDASLEGWWPCQDDAASTAVDDASSNANDGTLQGGDNTTDISTTGPNSWLTKSLDLDGSADYITMGAIAAIYGASAMTLMVRIAPDVATRGDVWGNWGTSGSRKMLLSSGLPTNSDFAVYSSASGTTAEGPASDASGYSTGTWYSLAGTCDGADLEVFTDGSSSGTSSAPTGFYTSSTSTTLGASEGSSNKFNGNVAEATVFSRVLTGAEIAQWHNGPEYVNTVAPAVTGTETEGETLSCTTGTWALPSPFASGTNGTNSLSYQWTRSDDSGGTGEADISGATSSTYVLAAADVGKFIRCRVRGTSDVSGFDSSADTNSNMSGEIAAAGAGNLRHPVRPFLANLLR